VSADVIDIKSARGWAPFKESCSWCGHSCVGVIHESHVGMTECSECGLWAMQKTHRAPDGWSCMSEEELAEADWVRM